MMEEEGATNQRTARYVTRGQFILGLVLLFLLGATVDCVGSHMVWNDVTRFAVGMSAEYCLRANGDPNQIMRTTEEVNKWFQNGGGYYPDPMRQVEGYVWEYDDWGGSGATFVYFDKSDICVYVHRAGT